MKMVVLKLALYCHYFVYSVISNAQYSEQSPTPASPANLISREDGLVYESQFSDQFMKSVFESINKLKELTRKDFINEAKEEMSQKDAEMLNLFLEIEKLVDNLKKMKDEKTLYIEDYTNLFLESIYQLQELKRGDFFIKAREEMSKEDPELLLIFLEIENLLDNLKKIESGASRSLDACEKSVTKSINKLKELMRKHFLIEVKQKMTPYDLQMPQANPDSSNKYLQELIEKYLPTSAKKRNLRSYYIIFWIISQPSEEVFDEFILSIYLTSTIFSYKLLQCLCNAKAMIIMLKSFTNIRESCINEHFKVESSNKNLILEIYSVCYTYQCLYDSDISNEQEILNNDMKILKSFVNKFQEFLEHPKIISALESVASQSRLNNSEVN